MSEPKSQRESIPEPVSFGPYRIHELIGAGGMAEVYRATRCEADGTERPVVIKRVKPKHAGDPGFVRMFLDEAKLSAQLQHPNIVEVFEYGEINEHHYIAMEYLDGLHLQATHVRHVQVFGQPLPWEASVLIVRDMLRGLEYAHRKRDEQGRPMGLVHRDINLVNVMLDRDGTVKVLDFGIVKAADGIRSAETVGGVLKGKFGYMSPEQAEGRALDPRSDVFSAAIVLHELLTGRRLFWGEDDLAILRRVRAGEIPDPRTYRESVPEALVQVTLQGLARPLTDRYVSAAAMAAALDQVVAAEQIPDGTVRDVMKSLLPASEEGTRESMRRKRRRLTLAAWQKGVREAALPARAPASAEAAGELGTRDTEAAASPAGALEQETLIFTDARWLLRDEEDADPAGEPVLGEQDVTAVTDARIGDGTVDESTLILVGSQGDVPISDAERRLFPPTGRQPSEVLAQAETRILAEPEDGSGASAPLAVPEAAGEGPPRTGARRGVRLGMAVVLGLVLAALLVILWARFSP